MAFGSFHSTKIPVTVPEGAFLCSGVYGHADEKSQGLVAVEGDQQGSEAATGVEEACSLF